LVRPCRDDPQSGLVGQAGTLSQPSREPSLRFVLTGTFHSLNRGDSAMQLAAAQTLRALWPEAHIAIHSPNAAADRNLYREFAVLACSRRRPLAALRAVARAALWRATSGRVPLSVELQSYRKATVVIDLSGDGLTETFGWRCPLSHTIPLLLAHLLRVPFCLMAQTIGPFHRFRPWFRWILSRAAFITARDADTFRYLSAWNLPCPVELTADVAFLLEPGSQTAATAYLRSLGDFDPSRPTLGITPSNLYNVKSPKNGSRRARLQDCLSAVSSVCASFSRNVGAQVLVIPHVFGPGEVYDDRGSAEILAAAITAAGRKPLVVKDALAPPELKALIRCCDLFVGFRMHSVIAAVSQAIPVLAIAYSPKLNALMERLGVGEFATDLFALEADTLSDLLMKLWSEKTRIKESLNRIISRDVLPAARENFGFLRRQIGL